LGHYQSRRQQQQPVLGESLGRESMYGDGVKTASSGDPRRTIPRVFPLARHAMMSRCERCSQSELRRACACGRRRVGADHHSAIGNVDSKNADQSNASERRRRLHQTCIGGRRCPACRGGVEFVVFGLALVKNTIEIEPRAGRLVAGGKQCTDPAQFPGSRASR